MQKPIAVILTIICILKLILIGITAAKGFDFNDEGYIMNLISYGDLYFNSLQRVVYPIYRLFEPFHFSVYQLRLLRYLNEFVIASVFAFTLFSADHGGDKKKLFYAVCIVVIGTGLSNVSRIMSYNEIVYLAVSLVISLTLLQLFVLRWGVFQMLFVFVNSVIMGVIVSIKLPSFILLYSIYTITILWLINNKSEKKIAYTIAYLLITITTVFITPMFFFGINSNLIQWYSSSSYLISTIGYNAYSILYKAYIKNDLMRLGIFHILPAIVALKIASRIKHTTYRWWISFLSGLAVLGFLTIAYKPVYLGDFQFRFISLFAFLVLFSIVAVALEKPVWITNRLIVSSLLIFLVPFISAAGSNLPFSVSITSYLIPFFLVSFNFYYHLPHQVPKIFIGIVFIGVSFASYFHFGVYHVERNKESLLTQNTLLKLKNTTVIIDKERADFITNFSQKLKSLGVKDGAEVLPLNSMPGESYLLGLKSIGLAWYFENIDPENSQGGILFNCYHLEHLKFKRPPIILIRTDIPKQQLDCLQNAGIGFPAYYSKVDSIWNPIRNCLVLIYVPANL